MNQTKALWFTNIYSNDTIRNERHNIELREIHFYTSQFCTSKNVLCGNAFKVKLNSDVEANKRGHTRSAQATNRSN